MSNSRITTAFAAPFVVFMLWLMGVEFVTSLGRTEFLLAKPQFWIYPLQTVVCGALLIRYWKYYRLGAPKKVVFTLGIALLVLALWISPQALLGFAPRTEGFDPTVFPPGSPLYWATLGFRFLRLVVVVPLLEEVFWRGFLLRFLIREDVESVPFGTFSWASFGAVTLCFGLAHWGPDFPAALLTGALYNAVAIRTRSLSSCVLAHAVTNLLLGGYIMLTRQWGFW